MAGKTVKQLENDEKRLTVKIHKLTNELTDSKKLLVDVKAAIKGQKATEAKTKKAAPKKPAKK